MLEAREVVLCLRMGAKGEELDARGAIVEKGTEKRRLLLGKTLDIGGELWVQLVLLPWEVFAGRTDACRCPCKAFFDGEVEEKDGVRTLEALFERAQVVAVDYPALAGENLCQTRIERIPFDMVAIWEVPHHIQIHKRKAQLVVQRACEGALAGAGTAYDKGA